MTENDRLLLNAYIDGELCGVDEAGLPSFAHTQAATDGDLLSILIDDAPAAMTR